MYFARAVLRSLLKCKEFCAPTVVVQLLYLAAAFPVFHMHFTYNICLKLGRHLKWHKTTKRPHAASVEREKFRLSVQIVVNSSAVCVLICI